VTEVQISHYFSILSQRITMNKKEPSIMFVIYTYKTLFHEARVASAVLLGVTSISLSSIPSSNIDYRYVLVYLCYFLNKMATNPSKNNLLRS